MTVASTTSKSGPYSGNGVTTNFAVLFKYTAKADVDVIVTSSAGVETTKTLDTHYTLTVPGDTGTVSFITTPTDFRPQTGETVTIVRTIAMIQDMDLTSGGGLSANTVEANADTQLMQIQEIAERVSRAPLLRQTSAAAPITLPQPVADNLITWNSAGTDLENKVAADLDIGLVSPFMLTLLDDTTAAAARTTLDAQQLDADLTAIAALTTTAYGRSLLTLADDDTLAAEISEFYQPLSAALTAYPDPTANDADALGTPMVSWSDLFLASGGVIGWNNGDVTITHSANALAFAGATSGYSFDDDITQARVGGLWTDAPNFRPTPIQGVNIARFERVFVGAACDNTGVKIAGGTTDWLEDLASFTTSNAELAVVSQSGRHAIVCGVRTSDNDTSPSNGIALSVYLDNDNASFSQNGFGMYIEAWRRTGQAFTTCMEVDINNVGNVVDINPYSTSFADTTSAFWCASGGEETPSPNDASVGIALINNNAAFRKGIVFEDTSITGTDGITGTGEAIVMAKGHQVNWYANNEGLVCSHTSLITLAANRQDMVVDDSGREFRNAASLINFRVLNTTGTLTGNIAVRASTAADPSILAEGSATNIPITLTPKGTGTINLDGGQIVTGAGVSTGDVGFELGSERSGNGNAYIDFHATSGSDFEARVFRNSGANGSFQFTNSGTGPMQFAGAAATVTQFIIGGAEDFRNDGGGINLASGKTLRVNGTQVVRSRVTGWTAATGTKVRTTFVATAPTAAEVGQRLGALIDDLITHGLIGT